MTISVLVVEDDDLMRASLVSALSISGISNVDAAKSSAEAIRIGKIRFPNVALLDLHLGPGPNGLDVAIALRKQNPTIGIVFLTTYEDPRLLLEQRPLPRASRYLLKKEVADVASLVHEIESSIGAREVKGNYSPVNNKYGLNNLQFETFSLVAQGLSNSEIAKRRGVTEKSVESMLSRISKALHIANSPESNGRVQLVRKYFELTGTPPSHGK